MRALKWLQRLVMPRLGLAHDKRRLEGLLRDAGLSKAEALRVVARFYSGLAQ